MRMRYVWETAIESKYSRFTSTVEITILLGWPIWHSTGSSLVFASTYETNGCARLCLSKNNTYEAFGEWKCKCLVYWNALYILCTYCMACEIMKVYFEMINEYATAIRHIMKPFQCVFAMRRNQQISIECKESVM